MNVKDVVQRAINYVTELFAQEQISNLGLEEIVFDPAVSEWIISVGFSRPWDYPKNNMFGGISNLSSQPTRVYKVLRIKDIDGEVLSIKNRT